MGKVRWQKAEGALARVKGKEFTPEDGEDGCSPESNIAQYDGSSS